MCHLGIVKKAKNKRSYCSYCTVIVKTDMKMDGMYVYYNETQDR